MPIDLQLLGAHILISFLLGYFGVAIFRKELYWTVNPFLRWRKYAGTRAVSLGFFLLFLFAIALKLALQVHTWIHPFYALGGLAVGVPLAYLVNIALGYMSASPTGSVAEISRHVPARRVTLGRFVFFFVAGGSIGLVIGLGVFVLEGGLITSIVTGAACALLTTWLLARANWM